MAVVGVVRRHRRTDAELRKPTAVVIGVVVGAAGAVVGGDVARAVVAEGACGQKAKNVATVQRATPDFVTLFGWLTRK